jgi:acyl-[acyl-carrier-protein]-phospholipid O-acyltransferase / long-chain-fatty-acid--[acyl-carrier-protein] ligase
VPDRRKGEKLVLVTTERHARRDAIVAHARAKGAADLMVPAEVLHFDKLPVLGTGKADFVAIRALVDEHLARSSPEMATN